MAGDASIAYQGITNLENIAYQGLSSSGEVIPPTPSNLKILIDASQEASIVESLGIVSQINDLSGAGNNVQAVGTPSTGAYLQNNLNHIQTYGLNDAFTGNFEIINQYFTFFIVARVNEVSNTNGALFTFTDSSGLKTNIVAQDATKFKANAVSTNHLNLSTAQVSYGYNYNVYCYTMSAESAGDVSLLINGITQSTSTLYAPWGLGTAVLQIGRNSDLTNFVNIDLAEFRYYDNSLTAAEVQSISDELIEKWAVLDLREYYGFNLRGYWDFSNIASLTYSSGANISRVDDISSRNKDLTTTAVNNQPTSVFIDQNGLDVALFDGTDDFLSASNLSTLSSFSVFIVCKIPTQAFSSISSSLYSIDSTGNDFDFQANSLTNFGAKLETNYSGDITPTTPPAPFDGNDWQIFSLHFKEQTPTTVIPINLYHIIKEYGPTNHIKIGTSSTSSGVLPSGIFRLASDRSNSAFIQCYIGECITTQNPTTAEQRNTVYKYLRAKWDI